MSYLSGRTSCISIEGVLSGLSELVYVFPKALYLNLIYLAWILFLFVPFLGIIIFSIIFMRITLSCMALLM